MVLGACHLPRIQCLQTKTLPQAANVPDHHTSAAVDAHRPHLRHLHYHDYNRCPLHFPLMTIYFWASCRRRNRMRTITIRPTSLSIDPQTTNPAYDFQYSHGLNLQVILTPCAKSNLSRNLLDRGPQQIRRLG